LINESSTKKISTETRRVKKHLLEIVDELLDISEGVSDVFVND
jgi:hypothetical protein